MMTNDNATRLHEAARDLWARLAEEGRPFDAAVVRELAGVLFEAMKPGETEAAPEGKAPAAPPRNKGGRPKKVPQPALALTTGGGEPSTASKSADAAAPSANGEIPASMADLVTGP